ncbi:MAG: SWIM zinc finger domain-containing protein, partial [Betaproteobacteria bacterium]
MNAAVLTLDGLRAEFGGPTFQRARALADGRFVKRVEYGADGFIHAQVASSTGYGVYEQRIELIDDGDVVVEGECSCPMEVNCKHVAAALFV